MDIQIAKMIDHTLLKANATKEEVIKLCKEAKKYGFASVCINPIWVKTAAELLKNTNIAVCTVIGFPLGANTTEIKVFETKNAIENGATEIDMVINVGALKDKENKLVLKDIQSVVEMAKGKAIVKVIIETCLLNEEEKIRACEISVQAGANFVKTSTGFSSGGATAEDVKLMRSIVGPNIGVKASGGIRSKEDLKKMADAGANRIGASSGVEIVKGLKAQSEY
jgi:deoxyribose-phosphate aldolase